MDPIICVLFITISIKQCGGVSLRRQMEHITDTRRESYGIPDFFPSRRYYDFHPGKSSVILGAPSMASHLPEAEPILPGHTLIRPALDMLKSAVKFPHRDMDNGAGVYGNIDNLSIKYDGRNERVLYSGFRKMNGETMAEGTLPKNNISENNRSLLQLLRENIKKNRLNIINNAKKKLDKSKQKTSLREGGNNRRLQPQAAYVLVDLDKANNVKRIIPMRQNVQKENPVIIIDNAGSEDSDQDDDFQIDSTDNSKEETTTKTYIVNQPADSKSTLFWNSKNLFNHIKISPEALDFNELVPDIKVDNDKAWWFFHEADFEPFEKFD